MHDDDDVYHRQIALPVSFTCSIFLSSPFQIQIGSVLNPSKLESINTIVATVSKKAKEICIYILQ